MIELAALIICLPVFIGLLIVLIWIAIAVIGGILAIITGLGEMFVEASVKLVQIVSDGMWTFANWQYDLLARFFVFLCR